MIAGSGEKSSRLDGKAAAVLFYKKKNGGKTIERLDEMSAKTNRSRNELINILIESAMEIVKIEE